MECLGYLLHMIISNIYYIDFSLSDFYGKIKKVDGQVLIDLPFHQLLLKSYFFISA